MVLALASGCVPSMGPKGLFAPTVGCEGDVAAGGYRRSRGTARYGNGTVLWYNTNCKQEGAEHDVGSAVSSA